MQLSQRYYVTFPDLHSEVNVGQHVKTCKRFLEQTVTEAKLMGYIHQAEKMSTSIQIGVRLQCLFITSYHNHDYNCTHNT